VRIKAMIAGLALVAASAACSGNSGSGGSTTLTLWHNYGTEQNAVATGKLVAAFEASHPKIKIKVVSQPADNYFSLLQAAAVSRRGPDLATMWTGLFTLKYKSYLVNLKGKVPDSALAKIKGLQWTAADFNAGNGPYVMPLENQFYMGFYNTDAFGKAGVAVPKTWDELYAACGKLKKAGYTPLVYGNGGQSIGAQFYPWYDTSYLMAGALTAGQWRGLYDGQVAWNSPQVVGQLTKWAKLKTAGCTNSDVLTKTDNLGDFTKGKAAMIIDGTWDTAKFTDALGTKVASFIPPFSDTPAKGVVEYAGDGFAVTKYSSHQQAALEFVAYLASPEAAKIIDTAGLISDLNGGDTSNPVNRQMLAYAASGGLARYPMLDNVVQQEIVDAGSKLLPSVLAGQMSPADAGKKLADALGQLPAERRGPVYK
jgi:raffinose/stachyose/melibiose transport system substrate-binding protein